MSLTSGYEERRARVELIPLIDVVFLLLVFFIYAMLSMTVNKGIDVELPDAGTSILKKGEYVSISITGRGEIFLDGVRTMAGELPGKVKEKVMGKKTKPVFINGDRGTDLGTIVNVLDGLNSVGIREVTIKTKEPGR